MWTILIEIIVCAGIGAVFFLLGQVSLQKKIEKKTDVAYRNYAQAELLIAISKWKHAWDDLPERG